MRDDGTLLAHWLSRERSMAFAGYRYKGKLACEGESAGELFINHHIEDFREIGRFLIRASDRCRRPAAKGRAQRVFCCLTDDKVLFDE